MVVNCKSHRDLDSPHAPPQVHGAIVHLGAALSWRQQTDGPGHKGRVASRTSPTREPRQRPRSTPADSQAKAEQRFGDMPPMIQNADICCKPTAPSPGRAGAVHWVVLGFLCTHPDMAQCGLRTCIPTPPRRLSNMGRSPPASATRATPVQNRSDSLPPHRYIERTARSR